MEHLQKSIEDLTTALINLAKEESTKGTAEPEEEVLLQPRCKDFRYTEKGVETGGSEGEYINQKTWFRATIGLLKAMSALPAYTEAERSTKENCFAIQNPSQALEQFGSHILNACFQDSGEPSESVLKGIQARFLRDLRNGPINYHAKVSLQGVTLEMAKINLGNGVMLRQTLRQDLEVPIRVYVISHRNWPDTPPSAILEIALQGDKHQGQELQRKVEQYVAILRLFAVGGVRSSEYQMSSDSLIDWTARGTIGSNFRHLPARETYFIKTGDEAKLMQFVRVLAGALPKDLYDSQGRTDHLTIAFKRYSEALLEATIIESRITTAMMGLEALFLDDSKELAYKLAVRISKAMSFLNHNPFAVRDFVYKAYGIRSTFAHGGHLTYKETKKLEKRYGGVEKILQAVLDYLRISILVMILSHQDKEMFIDLIDDALVDRQKSTDLENRLTQLRDFV